MNALEIEQLAKEILATTNPADIDFLQFHKWASRANSYAVSYCPGALRLIEQATLHVATLEDQPDDSDEPRDFYRSPCNTGDYLD